MPFTKMETIQISSLEQVPAGLNLLLKRIDELEAKIDSKPSQQLTSPATGETLRTRLTMLKTFF